MMWLGLMGLFDPLSVMLDFVPIFGALSRSLTGLVVLVATFVLTTVTILVSMLLHSLIALALAIGVTIT